MLCPDKKWFLRDDLVDIENVNEVEEEARQMADKEDDDDADQYHGQVHLACHVLLPATDNPAVSQPSVRKDVDDDIRRHLYIQINPGSSHSGGGRRKPA
jgi:hypothetical protein